MITGKFQKCRGLTYEHAIFFKVSTPKKKMPSPASRLEMAFLYIFARHSDQLSRESVLILQQRIILTRRSLPQIGNNSEDMFYGDNYDRMGKALRFIKINDLRRAVQFYLQVRFRLLVFGLVSKNTLKCPSLAILNSAVLA